MTIEQGLGRFVDFELRLQPQRCWAPFVHVRCRLAKGRKPGRMGNPRQGAAQHQRIHQIGPRQGQAQAGPAAERLAHQIYARKPERFAHAGGALYYRRDRIAVGRWQIGSAEARQIDRNHMTVRRKMIELLPPACAVAARPVDEQQAGPVGSHPPRSNPGDSVGRA